MSASMLHGAVFGPKQLLVGECNTRTRRLDLRHKHRSLENVNAYVHTDTLTRALKAAKIRSSLMPPRTGLECGLQTGLAYFSVFKFNPQALLFTCLVGLRRSGFFKDARCSALFLGFGGRCLQLV